jgi:hypothetical protein
MASKIRKGNCKEKKEFVIFADVPPIPSEERLLKYKQAGFTYYNLTEDYVVRDTEDGKISDEYFKAIDDCHKAGLKVVLRTMRSNSPDYYDTVTDEFEGKTDGYYMCDEPSYFYVGWYGSCPIDKLVKLVDYYNEHGGDTLFHINLLQDYGMRLVHGKNPPRFEDYLDEYIEKVLKKVNGEKSLSTDHYPIAFDKEGVYCIKESALRDYYLIADRSKKLKAEGHDIRTGFCIQLTSDKGLFIREMECAEDVLFQTNFALAFGASLLEYYLYVGRGTGIISDKLTQLNYTPVYDWVKDANAVVNKLGDLLDYDWNATKTYLGTEKIDEHNRRAFESVKEFEPTSFAKVKGFTSTADAILTEFVSDKGYAYMAVNYTEPTSKTENVVTFDLGDVKSASVILDGVPSTMQTENGKITVKLLAGQGVVVIV